MYDLEYYTYKNEGPFGDKTNTNSVVAYNSVTRAVFDPITVKAKLPLNSGQVIMITPNSWPNQGRISQMYDELTIEGEGSSNGNNADTWSLRVKLNYGPL